MNLWKIKRELRRIYLKAAILPENVLGPLKRKFYDLRKVKLIQITDGARPIQDNVAVFLIYQPHGLLASALETCRYLTQNGYAVLVVSNAKLGVADKAQLLAATHRLIERPNFGYDFGGYRDGVLHVLDSGWRPENLLVMNDSVWFPVLAECDFLARVKDQSADVYGPVLSHDHLQSYMYNFKGRLVGSDFFRSYWQDLPITNNKVAVVQRCEKLLSPLMQQAGFSVGWLRANDESVTAICNLPDDELAEVIRYDQSNDNSLSRAFKELIVGQSGWRDRAIVICKKTVEQRYMLKGHPLVLLRDLRLPVMKKDRAPQYVRQRRVLLAGPLAASLESTVAAEVLAWDGYGR